MIYIGCRDAKQIEATELIAQMDNWVNIVSKRGYPYKFTDINQFNKFKSELKSGLDEIGVATSDVRIQGSSLRTPNANDLDVAVVVDNNSFTQLLKNRFSGRITRQNQNIDIINSSQTELIQLVNDIKLNPTNYNAQAKTFEHAFSTGKIRPQDIDGLNSLKDLLKSRYGDIDLSIIKGVGDFDLKPYIKL